MRMTFVAILWCIASIAAAQDAGRHWPFYAMHTGLRGPDVPDLASKVKLLNKLGYVGIGYTYNAKELPQLLKLLDEHKLELSAIYLAPFIEDGPDATLAESIKLLKGRTTRVELAFRARKMAPSDPRGDAVALDFLRKVSDFVGDTGPVVSVYPHRGFWAERVEDGARLSAQIKRANVGTHFNLVHWKWAPQKQTIEDLLRDVRTHLKCVTINGLAGDKIVALDQGDYDIDAFLKTLAKVGYKGPVGLQGYSVPGPSAVHLEGSMKRWREALSRLP